MKTRQIRTLCSHLVLLCLVASCAYKFSTSRAEIPGVSSHVSQPYKIFIPIADNKSVNAGMEAELPAAFAHVLAGLSNVDVVSSETEANLMLVPRVQSLQRGRGLGTLQGTSETSDAGGLATGAVTAREFKVSATVEIDLLERQPESVDLQKTWQKKWTRSFSSVGSYDSSLRLIPTKGSSSSSIINQSRERLVLKVLAEDIARRAREQIFQGF